MPLLEHDVDVVRTETAGGHRSTLASTLALSYYALVLSDRAQVIAVTALVPAVWGTTYAVTTELLPPDRPLLAATIRALPAGLLLVAVSRRLPAGSWWWRAGVLGALNIGAFFALLFVAAYRLPGGVAAVAGAVQPLLVAAVAVPLLGERTRPHQLLAAVAGLVGVTLLVLRAEARLDAVGVAAALGGACAMAAGVTLAKRWGLPAPVLAVTGWQLVAGGLLLLPLTLAIEGPPPTAVDISNIAGYAYLSLIGTAAAYTLWFRGIQALPVTDVTLLGLLSPVVATVLGWLALDQALTPGQVTGAVIVLCALTAAQQRSAHRPPAERRNTPARRRA